MEDLSTEPLCAIGQVVESIGVDIPEKAHICRVCLTPVFDRYMCKIGREVCHERCATCVICGVGFDCKCYFKDDAIYCRDHYYSECSSFRCSGCGEGISPTDMVCKLKSGIVYHVSCHKCARCARPLSPGDQILVDEVTKTVSCMSHVYDQQDPSCSSIAPQKVNMENGNGIHNGIEPSICISEFSIKRDLDSPSSAFHYAYDSSMFYDDCYDDGSKFLKRRGPRTTIKQNQLDVLNRIFSTTPKPSKHARAKLALETGLSMRVIQVWFQNRRSKERRLKHLCNYLRHYEQRGLIPPPIQFPPDCPEGSSSCSKDDDPFGFMGMDQSGYEDEEEESKNLNGGQ